MKKIKILHTSDWHLGKKFFKQSRLPEQQLFIEYLKNVIREMEIDVILIAGDIFDTPHPPHEAVSIYFEFLNFLSKQKVHAFIIAGNHDSGLFIESPSPLLEGKNITTCGRLLKEDELNLADCSRELVIKGTKIHFSLIPYFRNLELETLAHKWNLKLDNREDVLNLLNEIFDKTSDKNCHFNILLAHHLFGPYGLSGSEQGISLSNLDSIPLELIRGRYDYTALGHIHKAQQFNKEQSPIVYSGSPLPMRFSEQNAKSIEILTIDDGQLTHSQYELPIFREFLRLKLSSKNWEYEIEQFKKSYLKKGPLSPFVEVQLDLSEPGPGIYDSIRKAIEEMDMQLISFLPQLPQSSISEKSDTEIISKLQNIDELFQSFYNYKYPDSSIPVELKNLFHEVIEETSHQRGDVS
ncbi:MAG: exonuclease SbcCD subunit D C-terminal domain-containing protein [Bdellovibrio sp.]